MKLTVVEFQVKEDRSVDYKKGAVYTYLQGEDGEYYKLVPGVSIEVSDEDLQVVESSEDSLLERVE